MALKGVTLAEKLRLARKAGVSLPHYTNTDNPVDFPQSKTDESINILIKNRNYMKYELIEKLAEQAEQYANEQNDKYGARFKTEYNNKFAELIVAECTAVLFDESERLSGLYSEEANWQSAEEYEICSNQCVDDIALIEKHFGVEE